MEPDPEAAPPTKVLHRIPLPPLHTVRLGMTNHLVDCLTNLWPELQV